MPARLAQVVAGPWDERTITNSAPALGATVASTIPVATDNAFVTVDVTTAVKNWLDGVVPINGLALVAKTPIHPL